MVLLHIKNALVVIYYQDSGQLVAPQKYGSG